MVRILLSYFFNSVSWFWRALANTRNRCSLRHVLEGVESSSSMASHVRGGARMGCGISGVGVGVGGGSSQATASTMIAVNRRTTGLTCTPPFSPCLGRPPHLLSHSSDRHSSDSVYHDPIFGPPSQKFAVRYALAHQMPMRVRLHPHPKRDTLVDRRYVCIIWIRLPQVSSKTAMVTLGNSVGSIVKATPSDFSFSYSARMSVTLKDAAGMPWSNIPF